MTELYALNNSNNSNVLGADFAWSALYLIIYFYEVDNCFIPVF